MVPFDELIFKPLGREPDVIEKEISSPLTVGEIENGLSLVITQDDCEYENDEIGVRIVNVSVTDRSLTSFDALIVTD